MTQAFSSLSDTTYYTCLVEREHTEQSVFAKWSKVFAGLLVGSAIVGTAMTVYMGLDLQSEAEREFLDQSVFHLLTTSPLLSTSRPTIKPLEARVAGVDIPNNKRVEFALQRIYGVGPKIALQILDATGISPDIRAKDLSEDQLTALREELNKPDYTVEGDLRREVRMNIDRLQQIKAYRGIRHRMGLPVRGQGTKNNARTRKGKRVAIPGKKK